MMRGYHAVGVKWMGFFVISTLFVLPLFFKKDYTDLFDLKYLYYYISALLALVCFVIGLIRAAIVGRTDIRRRTISGWEKALLIFVLACIISTLQSDYRFEAFWGNEARYNGLFLMLLCCITTWMIARNLNMKLWYLDIFMIGGIIVSGVGILDYFYIDLLNMKWNMTLESYPIFMSTIGNINSYTSYLALVLAVAAGVFITEKKPHRLVLYFACYIIFFIAIIMGTSDNAYLAIGSIMGLLPLYAFKRKRTTRRYMLLLSSSLTIIQAIVWVNEWWGEYVIGVDSLIIYIGGNNWMLILLFVLWGITACFYLKSAKGGGTDDVAARGLRYLWIGCLMLVICAIGFVLYDANIAGNAGRYERLGNYIVFSDEWGTYRGFAWRIAWENYVRISPLHKVFGYGLDTFSILTINYNKREMLYDVGSFYDSVHNEYLQYLVTIGIVGLSSYLALCVVALRTMIRHIKEVPYLLGIVLALLAYWVQAVVNISQVPVAPMMWCLMGVGIAACNDKKSVDSVGNKEQDDGEKKDGFIWKRKGR